MIRKKGKAAFAVLMLCILLSGCGSRAVEDVEKQINQIGTVSLESRQTIESAREAYERLSEDEKTKVGNLETLTAAENQLEAREIEALIGRIQEVQLDSETEALIQEARSAYENASDAVKEEVNDSVVKYLKEKEEEYQKLVEQKQAEEETRRAERDADALGKLKGYIGKSQYRDAVDYVEEYCREIAPETASRDFLETSVKAYVELAKQNQRHQDEEAERLLERCVELCADCEAVQEAKDALKEHEDYLEGLIPENGNILESPAESGLGELIIENRNDRAVLIKLENTGGRGKEPLRMYVHAKQTATVNVKDGEYTVKVATGDKWYGPTEIFGSKTEYYALKEIVRFETLSDAQGEHYQAATITLSPGTANSDSTNRIEANAF